jgi:hypothetical protein
VITRATKDNIVDLPLIEFCDDEIEKADLPLRRVRAQ